MLSPLIAALRFLTILPIPGGLGHEESDLSRSVVFFPVVGLAIGATAWLAGHLFLLLFSPLVAAVLLTLVLLAASGGLHMDGLADTADGFFSSRPRERILEIMRDSRVGAMGVIAMVLVILLKSAALASCDRQGFLAAALLMPLAGRVAIVLSMAILPYARPRGGLATLFYGRPVGLVGIWSLLLLTGASWYAAGLAGVAAGISVLFLVLLFAFFCRARINGATGDTLGAVCELAETVVALVLSIQSLVSWLG